MTKFQFYNTTIEGLWLIEPFMAEDERGYFSKFYERGIFEEHGIKLNAWECMESHSAEGVIRGLHFQRKHWQSKLVRCTNGEIFDVAVDLREGSPTYGKWEGFYLNPENKRLLYIPEGFAHGVMALKDNTIHTYICGDMYDPDSDGGIRWDDSDVAVEWPLDKISKQVIISKKDRSLPSLREITF